MVSHRLVRQSALTHAIKIASAACPSRREANATDKSPLLASGSSKAAVTSSETPLDRSPTTVDGSICHLTPHVITKQHARAIRVGRAWLKLATVSSNLVDHRGSRRTGYPSNRSFISSSSPEVDDDGAGTVAAAEDSGRRRMRLAATGIARFAA